MEGRGEEERRKRIFSGERNKGGSREVKGEGGEREEGRTAERRRK